jgi:hypothetical protein
MDKQTRGYEELITLQDKAIEALTQANAALLLALDTLKRTRAEHGFIVPLPGLAQPFIGGGVGGISGGITAPNTTGGLIWGHQTNSGMLNSSGEHATKTVTANALITQANSQKALATAYVLAFQDWAEKESNGVSKSYGASSIY